MSLMQTRELRGGIESEIRMKMTAQREKQATGEQTSENNDFLRIVLSNNPKADTNDDGVLTMEEARVFVSKKREEKRPRRRKYSGYPFGLKESYEERFYTSEDNNVLRYYLMKPEDYNSRTCFKWT